MIRLSTLLAALAIAAPASARAESPLAPTFGIGGIAQCAGFHPVLPAGPRLVGVGCGFGDGIERVPLAPGDRLPSYFLTRMFLADARTLPPAPAGAAWVRYFDEPVLVDRDGYVLDVAIGEVAADAYEAGYADGLDAAAGAARPTMEAGVAVWRGR